MKNKIKLTDSAMDILMKMAEVNPGAISVLVRLLKEEASIDPQSMLAASGLGSILQMDSGGIYGASIWMLFKDVCQQNIRCMVALLRAVQLGILPQDELIHAINNHGDGINVEDVCAKVKVELPEFQLEEPA